MKTCTNLYNKLSTGPLVVIVATTVGSFLSYLLHLLLGRLLSPADYGALTSLLSLFYIIGVPGSVLSTAAIKFASKYKARGDYKAVTAALVWISKVVSVAGLVIFGTFVLFRQELAHFLNISDASLIVVTAISIAFSFLSTAPVGFLNGLLRFKAFAFVSLVGAVLRLALSVGPAFLGWGLLGVLWGGVAAIFLTLVMASLLLRKNLEFPFAESSFSSREILRYAVPTVFIFLALNAFYNSDVVLVKHFFDTNEAGVYGSLVTMGRIIFFGLSSIGLVMFPLVSEKYERGGNYSLVFRKALGLVALGSLAAWGIYGLFPNFLVGVLFGNKYAAAVPYLGQFALFMGLYSLVNLSIQFFLSTRQLRIAVPLCVLAVVQVVGLWVFHGSLQQVIYVNIATMVGALAMLGIHYFRTLHPTHRTPHTA